MPTAIEEETPPLCVELADKGAVVDFDTLLAYYQHRRSVRRTARALHLNESTVSRRIRRAVARLQAARRRLPAPISVGIPN